MRKLDYHEKIRIYGIKYFLIDFFLHKRLRKSSAPKKKLYGVSYTRFHSASTSQVSMEIRSSRVNVKTMLCHDVKFIGKLLKKEDILLLFYCTPKLLKRCYINHRLGDWVFQQSAGYWP
jgi:hypothetical protein